MWQYNFDSELYHWGIKGMKWGVRRYQNPDGSLTPAGRKRYSDGSTEKKSATSESSSQSSSKAESSTASSKPKSISDMSDDELRKLVNRKQTERQLRDLIEAENRSNAPPQTNQEKSQSIIATSLKNAGSQALTTMAKGAMLYAGSTFVKKVLDNPELAKAIATGSMGGSKDDKKN